MVRARVKFKVRVTVRVTFGLVIFSVRAIFSVLEPYKYPL